MAAPAARFALADSEFNEREVIDLRDLIMEVVGVDALLQRAEPQVVPTGIVGYGKGGSIDWQGFHCLSLPGQMLVGKTPVNFCFTINWPGPDSGVPEVLANTTRVAISVPMPFSSARASWTKRSIICDVRNGSASDASIGS